MLLIAVKEDKGWLLLKWNLTYAVGWEQILKAAHSMFDYYDSLEILVNNKVLNVSAKGDITKLDEAGSMTVRGLSKILKIPMMITFFNQVNTVYVSVAQTKDEFKTADYQRFNMSLGQYMDSIELSMYR